MHHFFIAYRTPDMRAPATIKERRSGLSLQDVLTSVGYPKTPVFGVMMYATVEEVDSMIAATPAGKVLSAEDWESQYGPVENPAHLWARLSGPLTPAHAPSHRLTYNGSKIHYCTLTGHVRHCTIGEYYGNWTTPKIA